MSSHWQLGLQAQWGPQLQADSRMAWPQPQAQPGGQERQRQSLVVAVVLLRRPMFISFQVDLG
jgi:hypothetical protein